MGWGGMAILCHTQPAVDQCRNEDTSKLTSSNSKNVNLIMQQLREELCNHFYNLVFALESFAVKQDRSVTVTKLQFTPLPFIVVYLTQLIECFKILNLFCFQPTVVAKQSRTLIN